MAINYIVKSDVVDINNDIPQSTDSFFVDTNVWFWLTYNRASQSPIAYRTASYPSYIQKALNANSKLYRCNLSLSELAHLIEKTEHEVYCRSNGKIKTKEFRHNYPNERNNVVLEIENSWLQVQSIAKPAEIVIDENAANLALSLLKFQNVDGYDLFMLQSLRPHGVSKVITDDGDFATIPGIQVFTANKNLIECARIQGKLLVR